MSPPPRPRRAWRSPEALDSNRPAAHLAAVARMQGHMMVLDACIRGLQEGTQAAHVQMTEGDRQTLMTGLLKKQQTLTLRWEDDGDWPVGQAVNSSYDAPAMSELAASYAPHVAGLTMLATAERCLAVMSHSSRPFDDPMCTAWMLAVQSLREFSVQFATQQGGRSAPAAPEDLVQLDPDFVATALAAEAAATEMLKRANERYSQGIPTRCSPAVASRPDLARRWTSHTPSPTMEEYEITWTADEADLTEGAAGATSIVISMIANGERYIGTTNEPLPIGTTAEAIDALMDRIDRDHNLHGSENVSELPDAVYHACGVITRRIRYLATLGLHTVTPEMVDGLINKARAQRRSAGQLTSMLVRLTESNQRLAAQLASGSDVSLHLADTRQTAALLVTATACGMDDDQVRALCRLLGQDATDMIGPQQPADLSELEELMNAALESGIPDRAVVRIMESLLSDRQPFFHCLFDGARFSLRNPDAADAAHKETKP